MQPSERAIPRVQGELHSLLPKAGRGGLGSAQGPLPGKISNNINNNFNTFNINNIFKNVLPKPGPFGDCKENQRESQKSIRARARRKRGQAEPEKNYFLREAGERPRAAKGGSRRARKGAPPANGKRAGKSRKARRAGKSRAEAGKGRETDSEKKTKEKRGKPGKGARAAKRLKKAKSIEKLFAKLGSARAGEARAEGLLKAHKSIPNLKQFTDRKRSAAARKMLHSRSKRALKAKPRTGQTLSRRKLRAGARGKNAPEAKEARRRGSRRAKAPAPAQFFETVAELGAPGESLMDKVKKLKFSELPKKSLKQKEKARLLPKAALGKVKFALAAPGKSGARLRAKGRRPAKMEGGGRAEPKRRSRSGQKVMYLSRRKNKGQRAKAPKARHSSSKSLRKKGLRKAEPASGTRPGGEHAKGSAGADARGNLNGNPKGNAHGNKNGIRRKQKIRRAKRKIRKGNSQARAQRGERQRNIQTFLERLETNERLPWKHMSKEQMGKLLLKARDMFREFYGRGAGPAPKTRHTESTLGLSPAQALEKSRMSPKFARGRKRRKPRKPGASDKKAKEPLRSGRGSSSKEQSRLVRNREPRPDMFQNPVLQRLPAPVTNGAQSKASLGAHSAEVDQLHAIANAKSRFKLTKHSIRESFQVNRFDPNGSESQARPAGNRTSCVEIQDVQVPVMQRGPSTCLELVEEGPGRRRPQPTLKSFSRGVDGSETEGHSSQYVPETRIISNQAYVYRGVIPKLQEKRDQTKTAKGVQEKGVQKNTFMTNECTLQNATRTSKELSSAKQRSWSRREPVGSSLSLRQLTQTLKQNDRLLDGSCPRAGSASHGRRKGRQDKMYFNPSKLKALSPPQSVKRSLVLPQSTAQLVENRQVFQEGGTGAEGDAPATPNLSRAFCSSRLNARRGGASGSRSFQNLPALGKGRRLRTGANSRSGGHSQSVMANSQSLLRDFSPEGAGVSKKNKSEFFGGPREKAKRYMDKSLPSCSLFLRAKTMTEVAGRKPKRADARSFEKKLPPGAECESEEESCAGDANANAEPRTTAAGKSAHESLAQNIEVRPVSEGSVLASIQHLAEQQAFPGRRLCPTPLQSVALPSGGAQNLYSRPSESTEAQVQEIQIYSRSRRASETQTPRSVSPKGSGGLGPGAARDFKLDTASDALQAVDTRFSEYTPREIDSLIYNAFPKKTSGASAPVDALNIQNLYSGGAQAREIDRERVSVSVSESNHEVFEGLQLICTSANALNRSRSRDSNDLPAFAGPAMDTFRQRAPAQSLAQIEPGPCAERGAGEEKGGKQGGEKAPGEEASAAEEVEGARPREDEAPPVVEAKTRESSAEQLKPEGDTEPKPKAIAQCEPPTLTMYKESDATKTLELDGAAESLGGTRKNPFFETNFSFGSGKRALEVENPDPLHREEALLKRLVAEQRTGDLEGAVVERLVEDFLEDSLYKEIFLPGGEASEGIETDVERVETYVQRFTAFILGSLTRERAPRNGPPEPAPAPGAEHGAENVVFPRATRGQRLGHAQVQLPDDSPSADFPGLRGAHEGGLTSRSCGRWTSSRRRSSASTTK